MLPDLRCNPLTLRGFVTSPARFGGPREDAGRDCPTSPKRQHRSYDCVMSRESGWVRRALSQARYWAAGGAGHWAAGTGRWAPGDRGGRRVPGAGCWVTGGGTGRRRWTPGDRRRMAGGGRLCLGRRQGSANATRREAGLSGGSSLGGGADGQADELAILGAAATAY